MAEMPEPRSESSGRKSRGSETSASSSAARRETVRPEELQLMEAVVARENLLKAYAQVLGNKGAAGVDGMPVEQLKPYLQEQWAQIKESLLNDTYQPQPVRCVEIPKPNGGMRQLGIPTVVDRLIQQALHQVLSPLFEPGFSTSSYGFRPGRNAQQAVAQAREYVREGRRWVVDLDLEKFFDRVNHDVLMSRLARRISDKRVLRLIRRYLQVGMMTGGVVSQRVEGTPQGGPRESAAVKRPARRTGQGTGTARSQVLPLRRRLQHLYAVAGGWRTGDGVGNEVPRRTSAPAGEHGEECSCAPVRAEIPGLLNDVAQTATPESGPGIHPAAEG